MSITNEWIIDNIGENITIDGISYSVDELIKNFDELIEKISSDKRNYLLEATRVMGTRIVTSKINNLIELENPDDFASGNRYILHKNISVVASRFLDGTADESLMTFDKLKTQMSVDFEKKKDILSSAKQKGSSPFLNSVSVNDLESNSSLISRSSETQNLTDVRVEKNSSASQNSVLNVGQFSDVFYPHYRFGEVESASITFPNSQSLRVEQSGISFLEMDITDAELSGSGSKLSDYIITTEATPASNYKDIIDIILNYGDDYTVNIDGTDYTYTADPDETTEDVALNFSDIIADCGANVTQEQGVWSKVFTNSDGDRVFGWYVDDRDDSKAYEVEFVVPSDTHDLTIEQDLDNPDKIIVTFEHDGLDPVYPTAGDIVELVNTFDEVPIRVVIMPGFDETYEYSTADNVLLDIGLSQIVIESSSQLNVTNPEDSEKPMKLSYTHVSDYTAAVAQSGYVDAIKFNPEDSFYIEIADERYDINPAEKTNVVDEQTLMSEFSTMINSDSVVSESSVLGSRLTIYGKNAGDSFTVTTSGENNYVVPVERDVLLRYDVRNIPNQSSSMIGPLYKNDSFISSQYEPLTLNNINSILSSGYLYTKSNMLLPSISDESSGSEYVSKIKEPALTIESIINKESSLIEESTSGLKYINKSMPVIDVAFNATPSAKSDRWYFIETGSNTIVPKTNIDVPLNTMPPSDYEKNIYQDSDATFDSIRKARIPSQDVNFGSINDLVKKDIPSYNKCGLSAEIPLSFSALHSNDIDYISEHLTEEGLFNFITHSIVRKINKEEIELYKALIRLSISIDDGLMEQRFIALAGAYTATSDELSEFFSDTDMANIVFGINEPDDLPEPNYGLGGTPIDSTVTLGNLYFRNMKSLAKPLTSKKAFNLNMTNDAFIYFMSSSQFIVEFDQVCDRIEFPNGSYLLSTQNSNGFITPVFNNTIPYDTYEEDRIYEEIFRTGFFPSDISNAISKMKFGFSRKYNDSVWNLLLDAIEIKQDGTIVSINSARTTLQEIYMSFSDITSNDLIAMLSAPKMIIENNDEARRDVYSALTTLYLKIALYLKENESSIAYTDWETSFNEAVGRIFLDDELEENILPYQSFLIFIASSGMLNAFSWSADIKTDVDSIYSNVTSALVYESVLKDIKITNTETKTIEEIISGDTTKVSVSTVEQQDGNRYLLSVNVTLS